MKAALDTLEPGVDDARARDAIARAAAGQLLGPQDIQAIFGLKKSQYFTLSRAKAFEPFKVRPSLGPKCFSGVLITKYLNGEPIEVVSKFRKLR